MARFLLGLIAGATSSAFTWIFTGSTGWAVALGLVSAALIWFREFLLDDLN
jgi:hypothetical protein